jgi:hypothetical protein
VRRLAATTTLALTMSACGAQRPDFGLVFEDAPCDEPPCVEVSVTILSDGGRYKIELISETDEAIRYQVTWTGEVDSESDVGMSVVVPIPGPLDGRAIYFNDQLINPP